MSELVAQAITLLQQAQQDERLAQRITDRFARPIPAMPAPPKGVSIVEPTFGTKLTRVTDAGLTTTQASWRVPSNAHLAGWSADGRRFTLVGPAGTWVFRCDPDPLLQVPVYSQCEPCWSRTDSAVLYTVGGSLTRTLTKVTFGRGAPTLTPILDLDTLGLGLLNPRTYVGGLATSDESVALFFGGTSQDQHRYVRVLKHGGAPLQIDTLAPGFAGIPAGFKLHSMAIDRTGQFVVLYPVGAQPFHMVVWDTDSNAVTPITKNKDGHDALGYGVQVNQDSGSQAWDAMQWQFRALNAVDTVRDLITPPLTPKEVYISDHTNWNNARPGQLLPVFSGTFRSPGNVDVWRAWDNEILRIATDGSSLVERLAHHRSDADEGFWSQPIVQASPDGRRVLFTSNWGRKLGLDAGGAVRQDVFLVEG